MSARVIVVAGFLGSGKTSLILALAQAFTAEGRRVAVIENESGDQGVDQRLLRTAGLTVREVVAGCICCTLAGDLRTAVSAMIAEHGAEVVIVEPTGVAGPGKVVEVLRAVPGVSAFDAVGVVDATRVEMINGINPYFIESLLWAANVVAVSKVDLLPPATVGRVVAGLRASDPRPLLVPIDTADPGVGAAVLAALAAAPPTELLDGPRPGAISAGVCSRELRFSAADAATIADRMRGILATLATALASPDGAVPGHLKAFVDAGAGGWLSFSATHAGREPDRRGALGEGLLDARATIIVVLAGGDRTALDLLLARATGTTPGIGLAPGRSLHG